MNTIFKNLINEICKEKNIIYQELSLGYILELKKEKKIRHISGHLFDLNTQASGNAINDKYATFCVLFSHNIPVVEHKILFDPKVRSEYMTEKELWNIVLNYFRENKQELVIKPCKGNNGNHVYLCKDIASIREAVFNCFCQEPSAVICPYYASFAEYRTFYLNGECLFTYRKMKPFVIGDGISSIRDLILQQNYVLPEKVLKGIPLQYVPKQQEKVDLIWKYNLSGGAIAELLEDKELEKSIQGLVKKAASVLNIRFATVDVLHTLDGSLKVLEVNSGICMEKFMEQIEVGHSIAKEIYGKAIDTMFEL